MHNLKRVLGIALFVGLLALGWRLAASNSSQVTVDYLFGEFTDIRLWVVLLVTFMAGAVITGSIATFELMKSSMAARRYRKAAEKLEAEIHQLRNLPLSGQAVASPKQALPEPETMGAQEGPVSQGVTST